MRQIDINCDMGELPEAIADRSQEALMAHITSVNVACGAHAGDAFTMAQTARQAGARGLAVGAHPGYPDRANFGRLEMDMTPDDLVSCIYTQLVEFASIAESQNVRLVHVKAHGALYNQAVHDRAIAVAIAKAVQKWKQPVVMVGLAGSPMLDVFREAGFRTAAEAFADRRYEPDGTLRSRRLDDALIRDPELAAAQALRIVEEGSVIASDGSEVPVRAQTICIHGDTPGAGQTAAAVARKLRGAGVQLRALGPG